MTDQKTTHASKVDLTDDDLDGVQGGLGGGNHKGGFPKLRGASKVGSVVDHKADDVVDHKADDFEIIK